MLESKWSSQQTIEVSASTDHELQVPNNRGGEAKWKAPSRLIVHFPKGKVEEAHWELEETQHFLKLTAGELRLQQLRVGMASIQAGEGDYAIGPGEGDDQMLYFWWQLPER